ncbi:MAG: 30S ribosomal protein S9 [Patescibacteria group bacterium]
MAEGKYIESVGRRKTSIARVRLFVGKGEIVVNEHSMLKYFPLAKLRQLVEQPLTVAGLTGSSITVKVVGGGIKGQAEAIRLGIARCLVKQNEELRTTLKKDGLLSRDSRRRERKKFGKLSARRSPQWSKR